MKKRIFLFGITFLLCFTTSACVRQEKPAVSNEPNSPTQSTEVGDSSQDTPPLTEEDKTIYTKDFGTYALPKDWIENEQYSTENKFFYFKEGSQNNISVNTGTNRYAIEDHIQFRYAIAQQLSQQLAEEDTTINGSGQSTENGDVVYVFNFTTGSGDNTMTTTQYYIVGDYKYLLIHETVIDSTLAEEADEAAKTIMNSFLWTDGE